MQLPLGGGAMLVLALEGLNHPLCLPCFPNCIPRMRLCFPKFTDEETEAQRS